MVRSRDKGKRGELEIAALIREAGFGDARRGRQYRGTSDSPDVIGLNGCHVEVKRRQRGNVYEWLATAAAEANGTATPVVFHRRDSQGVKPKWAVTLYASDFLAILYAAEYGTEAPLPADWQERDASGSYYDAIAALRERHKAGAPISTTGYFANRRSEP